MHAAESSAVSAKSATPVKWWRIAAVAAFLGNLALNYAETRLLGAPSTAEISAKYQTSFTPASYAFSIWGLIYLALGVALVAALRPSARLNPAHDALAKGVTLWSVLASSWIIAFHFERLWLSLGVIVAMLLVSTWLFLRADRAVLDHQLRPVWRVPYSLALGWLMVATLATLSVALSPLLTAEADTRLSLGLLSVATLAALIQSYAFRDEIPPLVVSWGASAIGMATREQYPQVSVAAFIAAAVSLIWGITLFTQRLLLPPPLRLRRVFGRLRPKNQSPSSWPATGAGTPSAQANEHNPLRDAH